jgi:hypothetical protein
MTPSAKPHAPRPWNQSRALESGLKKSRGDLRLLLFFKVIYGIQWGQICRTGSKKPAGLATFDTEEVRIPGSTERILQEVFFMAGNLKEISQPGLANGGKGRRRPR